MSINRKLSIALFLGFAAACSPSPKTPRLGNKSNEGPPQAGSREIMVDHTGELEKPANPAEVKKNIEDIFDPSEDDSADLDIRGERGLRRFVRRGPSGRPKKTACQFSQNDLGITWARLSEEEPNKCYDRIDFIYYSSDVTKTLESKTLDLQTSDHRGVLSAFEITDGAVGAKAGKPTPIKGLALLPAVPCSPGRKPKMPRNTTSIWVRIQSRRAARCP